MTIRDELKSIKIYRQSGYNYRNFKVLVDKYTTYKNKTELLSRGIYLEIRVPDDCDEDRLAYLVCKEAENEAKKLDFTQCLDPENDEYMIENTPEYTYHDLISVQNLPRKPLIEAVDFIEYV